jgi:hypothetical protein
MARITKTKIFFSLQPGLESQNPVVSTGADIGTAVLALAMQLQCVKLVSFCVVAEQPAAQGDT